MNTQNILTFTFLTCSCKLKDLTVCIFVENQGHNLDLDHPDPMSNIFCTLQNIQK